MVLAFGHQSWTSYGAHTLGSVIMISDPASPLFIIALGHAACLATPSGLALVSTLLIPAGGHLGFSHTSARSIILPSALPFTANVGLPSARMGIAPPIAGVACFHSCRHFRGASFWTSTILYYSLYRLLKVTSGSMYESSCSAH
jgi:hypothetical protein